MYFRPLQKVQLKVENLQLTHELIQINPYNKSALILALILQFDFEDPCDPQANTNKKLFVSSEPLEINNIQFDSPKLMKKWSLKYISYRVEKELQNQTVGYSEICQKLTEEMTQEMNGHSNYGIKDIKNLKRRVYDALNVMTSVGIVVKEKKMMRKNNDSQINITKQNLIIRKQKLKELLIQKKQQLTNSIKKQETLQNLIKLNKERETCEQEKIKHPFLLIKTQLTNSEEEELILESHKSMDYLKVLSKNKLQIFGILSIAQQLFQNQQSKD